MDNLDERLRLEHLYDVYGPLLTDKQRDVFTMHYHFDLSFGEMAERLGISRPAVADHLRRAELALAQYEERLGLASRERLLIEGIQRALDLLGPVDGHPDEGKAVVKAAIDTLLRLLPT